MTGNRRTGLVAQERDRRLLRELSVMRVIDREQAELVAGFRSVTRANARLLALTRAGLLNRFFIGTGAGGKKSLYTLSANGAVLIQAARSGLRRRRDAVLVGDAFVDHQLHLNRVYLAFKLAPVHRPGLVFRCWRVFREPLSRNAAIVPDGYVEIESAGKTLCMFVEADLGTEGLPLWIRKVEAYLRFARSGEFEACFRQRQFRVLIAMTSERRSESICNAIARLTDKIFWLSTFQAIEREGVWASVWCRPAGKGPVALLGGTP